MRRGLKTGIIYGVLLLCGALIVVVCRMKPTDPRPLPADVEVKVRAGDLVFRRGTGVEGRVVTTLDRSTRYSHVGIVVDSAGGEWHVVHATPSEEGEGPQKRLRYDPVSEFFRTDRASEGGIYRVSCGDSCRVIAVRAALGWHAAGVEFDNGFRMDDSTKLYCSELVWAAYMRAGIDLCEDRRHRIPALPEMVWPSDIFVSPLLGAVYEF